MFRQDKIVNSYILVSDKERCSTIYGLVEKKKEPDGRSLDWIAYSYDTKNFEKEKKKKKKFLDDK